MLHLSFGTKKNSANVDKENQNPKKKEKFSIPFFTRSFDI